MIEIVDIETAGDSVDERGIPRDKKGKPRIFSPCAECSATGKVESLKVAGRMNQCPKCKGAGVKGKAYARTTSFIDVLDDKTSLTDWKQRMVIEGIRRKPGLLEAWAELEEPFGKDKQAANGLAGAARDAADADLKAELGTALHEITEDIDGGKDPGFIPEEFVKDIEAYKICTADLEVIHIELFCVLDEYGVAGTFDRLVRVKGEIARMLGVPDGTLLIADLKTGGIEYGLGKIAMQLGAYSRMKKYDPLTFARSELTDLGDVNQDVALIIHMPSGEGRCELVPVNIAKGWTGLAQAAELREWRNFWNRQGSKGAAIVSITL